MASIPSPPLSPSLFPLHPSPPPPPLPWSLSLPRLQCPDGRHVRFKISESIQSLSSPTELGQAGLSGPSLPTADTSVDIEVVEAALDDKSGSALKGIKGEGAFSSPTASLSQPPLSLYLSLSLSLSPRNRVQSWFHCRLIVTPHFARYLSTYMYMYMYMYRRVPPECPPSFIRPPPLFFHIERIGIVNAPPLVYPPPPPLFRASSFSLSCI